MTPEQYEAAKRIESENTPCESVSFDENGRIKAQFTRQGGFSITVPYGLEWELTHVLGTGDPEDTVTAYFEEKDS